MRKSGFLESRHGATMVGYALLIGLILSITVAAVTGLGGKVTGGFTHASSNINASSSATESGGGGTPPSGPVTPAHQNPVITTGTSLPSAVAGQAYSASLEATASDSASITGWFVPSEQIPSGLTFSGATGALSGTPLTAGSYSFNATVTDSMGASADKTFSLEVSAGHQPPVITTGSVLPSSIAGMFYTTALGASASDGATISSWSIPSGQTPAGLSLASGTGVLSGTAVAGNYSFNATVTDSLGASAQQNFTLVIDPHNAPAITTDASLPSGIAGVAYSATFSATASNGASIASWDIPSADIPSGMTFVPATATLSGATSAGTYGLTATVTDSYGASAQKSFSLVIDPHANPVITTAASLGHGMSGDAFSVTFQASTSDGSTISNWSMPAGQVPAGLYFNAATLSGTLSTGSYSIPVTVTDSLGGSVQKTFTLDVDALLQVTTADLPGGIVNTAYTATIAASGGSGGYTWQATNLPAGLSIDSSTGVLSGTPTTTVTEQQVDFTVMDSFGHTATKSLSITVSAHAAPVIAPAPAIGQGTTGDVFSVTFQATTSNGATVSSWSMPAGSVPAGLAFNAATGTLSGTLQTGSYNFTVTVTDSIGSSGQRTFSLVVYPIMQVTTTSLPSGITGVAYTTTMAASGGSGIYTWQATNLAPGLAFDSSTGVLSGIPNTGVVAQQIAFTATDSLGHTATKSLPISVTAHTLPVITTNAALGHGMTGDAFSVVFQATTSDGATVSSWSIPAGNVPTGLSFNAATATLSGTLQAGSYSLPVTVTDSFGNSVQKTFTLVVDSLLQVTTTSLPSGITGVAYTTTMAASGGSSGYTWQATNLPAGLALNSSSGVLSGTPSAAVTSQQVNFTATDSLGRTATMSLPITVAAHTAPVITTGADLGHGMTGDTFSVAFQASTSDGASVSIWYLPAGSVPAGLSFNAATATLSGTLQAGSYSLPVTVTDSFGGSVQKTFSLVVDSLLQVTTTSLPSGSTGTTYTATLAASGGSGGYTWQATNLPDGLAIASSTGIISGTPTANVTAQQVALTVTDSLGRTATKSLPVTVSNCTHGSQTFNYTGALQSFTVNAGCTQMTVYAWGAGGGGGYGDTGNGGLGGGGAYVSGTINVTSISSVNIIVGGGGKGTASVSSNLGSAGGGGLSGVTVNGTYALVAAGGGGGGRYFTGGAGGINTGNNGSYGTAGLSSAGHGGSQSAGGIAGTYTASGYVVATDGSSITGGDGGGGQSHGSNSALGGYGGGGYGNYGFNAGGGGGGGWYGGGGGGGGLNAASGGNGGGGGSSLVPSGGTGTAGSGNLAGNRTGYWTSSIADGGSSSGGNGRNGLVVVTW